VYVLALPKYKVPVPVLVIPPAPEIGPLKFSVADAGFTVSANPFRFSAPPRS
jgi:hypothetical protein